MNITFVSGPNGDQGTTGTTGSSLFKITSNTLNYDTPFLLYDMNFTSNTSTQFKYTVSKNSLNVGFNNTINGNNSFVTGSNNSSSLNTNLIFGSSNNITSYNSAIIGGITNTIFNSNNSVIFAGSSNQILNSSNSAIIGSNITISNAKYSFGLGNGSIINAPYSFVWSDSTPRTNNTANSVYFGCANGFTINLNNTSGITITSNAILPLTNANMSIGSSALSFSNMYLNSNANIVSQNTLYLYNQTTTLLNLTATQIILYTSLSANNFGSTFTSFRNVYFTNNGGFSYGSNSLLSFTATYVSLNSSLIPSSNNTINIGSSSNRLNIIYAKRMNIFDSCVFYSSGSRTLQGNAANLLYWDGLELQNSVNPPNIVMDSTKSRFYNNNSTTRKWIVTIEVQYTPSSTSNPIQTWFDRYNSADTIINSLVGLAIINNPFVATIIAPSTGMITMNSGDYISIICWPNNLNTTSNPGYNGYANSRLYIREI